MGKPLPSKCFEFFRLETVYSSAFLMHVQQHDLMPANWANLLGVLSSPAWGLGCIPLPSPPATPVPPFAGTIYETDKRRAVLQSLDPVSGMTISCHRPCVHRQSWHTRTVSQHTEDNTVLFSPYGTWFGAFVTLCPARTARYTFTYLLT